MSEASRSVPSWIVGASSAVFSLSLACVSASLHRTPDGGFELVIVGDDARSIRARGLEEAFVKCVEHEQAALDRGDSAAAADWKSILERIVSMKEADEDQARAESEKFGTIEKLDDGSELWQSQDGDGQGD